MDKSLSKRKRISEVIKGDLSEAVPEESGSNAVGRAETEHVSKQTRAGNDKKS